MTQSHREDRLSRRREARDEVRVLCAPGSHPRLRTSMGKCSNLEHKPIATRGGCTYDSDNNKKTR